MVHCEHIGARSGFLSAPDRLEQQQHQQPSCKGRTNSHIVDLLPSLMPVLRYQISQELAVTRFQQLTRYDSLIRRLYEYTDPVSNSNALSIQSLMNLTHDCAGRTEPL